MRRHILIFIMPFVLEMGSVFAQQYPVQGSLSITPPYPAYLSDYANSSINKLYLTLTLTVPLATARLHRVV